MAGGVSGGAAGGSRWRGRVMGRRDRVRGPARAREVPQGWAGSQQPRQRGLRGGSDGGEETRRGRERATQGAHAASRPKHGRTITSPSPAARSPTSWAASTTRSRPSGQPTPSAVNSSLSCVPSVRTTPPSGPGSPAPVRADGAAPRPDVQPTRLKADAGWTRAINRFLSWARARKSHSI